MVAMAGPAPAGDTITVGDLTIAQPWARASAGKAKNGVAYMTLANKGTAKDRLVGATTPAARKASLHTHLMEGDIMKMRPVEAVEIAPGKSAVLKPGGLHVMLMGLKTPLKEGEAFPLTLTFENAGSVEVRVMVHKAGAMGPAHKHK
jgi:copper(I)-binding protein